MNLFLKICGLIIVGSIAVALGEWWVERQEKKP
jgi:hypothetical protein